MTLSNNIEKAELPSFDLRYSLPTRILAENLSPRTQNVLRGLYTPYVGQLIEMSEPEFSRLQNTGPFTQREVKRALAEIGLSLGTLVEGRPQDSKTFHECLMAREQEAIAAYRAGHMHVSSHVAAPLLDNVHMSKRVVRVTVVTDSRTRTDYDEVSRLLTDTASVLRKGDFRKKLELLVSKYKTTLNC